MWFKTAQILNAEEEISKLVDYLNIRMFVVRKMTATEPQNDLMEIYHNWDRWASVNETQYVKDFSAVCLLTEVAGEGGPHLAPQKFLLSQ